MNVNLVWRTDVHLSDRSPSSRLDNWSDTVFDKLGQVRDIAREVRADAIIDGGDFFHVKAPGRNSHELVRRTLEHHRNYPCPVYCTPGNHDSVYGDYSFLPQQPLGVVFASGAFLRLYDEHEVVFTREESGSTFKVRVVGIPYHGTSYDLDRFHKIKRKDEDILICVAHVLASEKGGTMFEGEDIIKYSDLLDTAPDMYCFGHWHKDQGVVELGGKKFLNIGSLTRGSLSQDEVERQPAAAVIKCHTTGGIPTIEVEVRRLVVKPASEVFDIEGRARQVRRQVEMDSFVNSIRDSLQPNREGETLSDAVNHFSGIPSEVKERALMYLEQV